MIKTLNINALAQGRAGIQNSQAHLNPTYRHPETCLDPACHALHGSLHDPVLPTVPAPARPDLAATELQDLSAEECALRTLTAKEQRNLPARANASLCATEREEQNLAARKERC